MLLCGYDKFATWVMIEVGNLADLEWTVWVSGWVVYQVAKTYGKVFHFWQFDKGDTLPLGLPQLMMSFTDYGQLNPELASGTIFNIRCSWLIESFAIILYVLIWPSYGCSSMPLDWSLMKWVDPAHWQQSRVCYFSTHGLNFGQFLHCQLSCTDF